MLNSITFMARQNLKPNKINLDKAKIAGYTAIGVVASTSVYDKFIQQGENIMDKEITEQDIINKIAEICYQGVEEPEYARQDEKQDEYDISLTVRSYYDKNGNLRKKTTESYFGYLENIDLYNEDGNLVYQAYIGEQTLNHRSPIERVFYDGSKEENITNSERLILNYSDLKIETESTAASAEDFNEYF